MSDRKAALITGGAIRVGFHFARHLAQRGYDIAIHYNSSAKAAAEAADNIRKAGVQCETFAFDFSAGKDPALLLDRVADHFPELRVLVNCASIYNAAPVAETTPDVLYREFQVNFFAPFLLSGAFARRVGAGNIVNIVDNKIAFQQYQYGAYLSAKKALAELTRMTAMEFAPRIRVNGIAPGVILPGDNRTADYIQWRVQGIPLKRQGQTDHLCRALDYLLENEFVTGQILYVDGGEGLFHIGQNAEVYRPG